jgi:hypothetical protein
MAVELWLQPTREQCYAVFVPLARSNRHGTPGQVDVLNAETEAFRQPQSATVDQSAHEELRPVQVGKDKGDSLPVKNHRKPTRFSSASCVAQVVDSAVQDVSKEEDKCDQCLLLR